MRVRKLVRHSIFCLLDRSPLPMVPSPLSPYTIGPARKLSPLLPSIFSATKRQGTGSLFIPRSDQIKPNNQHISNKPDHDRSYGSYRNETTPYISLGWSTRCPSSTFDAILARSSLWLRVSRTQTIVPTPCPSSGVHAVLDLVAAPYAVSSTQVAIVSYLRRTSRPTHT